MIITICIRFQAPEKTQAFFSNTTTTIKERCESRPRPLQGSNAKGNTSNMTQEVWHSYSFILLPSTVIKNSWCHLYGKRGKSNSGLFPSPMPLLWSEEFWPFFPRVFLPLLLLCPDKWTGHQRNEIGKTCLMVKIEVERERAAVLDNISASLLKKSHKPIISQNKGYLNCNLKCQ